MPTILLHNVVVAKWFNSDPRESNGLLVASLCIPREDAAAAPNPIECCSTHAMFMRMNRYDGVQSDPVWVTWAADLSLFPSPAIGMCLAMAWHERCSAFRPRTAGQRTEKRWQPQYSFMKVHWKWQSILLCHDNFGRNVPISHVHALFFESNALASRLTVQNCCKHGSSPTARYFVLKKLSLLTFFS